MKFKKLSQTINGVKKRSTKAQECKNVVTEIYTPLIERAYIRKYFDNETRLQINEIFKNIFSTFQEMLENNNWMDYSTKMEALNKV